MSPLRHNHPVHSVACIDSCELHPAQFRYILTNSYQLARDGSRYVSTSRNSVPTIPSSHRDILESAQIVTLATINPDGSPQVTATWFVWEDDTLKLSLNSSRQKMKNLQRNPALTAFFVDPATPYRTIELRGEAIIEEDDGYAVAQSVAKKYGSNPREMDQPGEQRLAVRLHEKKVNTFGN